uniref:Uncharacterized protein n=1 Tax=Arundo donax TaxID=35708 RepID=A0A0A9E362_ARUDO
MRDKNLNQRHLFSETTGTTRYSNMYQFRCNIYSCLQKLIGVQRRECCMDQTM